MPPHGWLVRPSAAMFSWSGDESHLQSFRWPGTLLACLWVCVCVGCDMSNGTTLSLLRVVPFCCVVVQRMTCGTVLLYVDIHMCHVCLVIKYSLRSKIVLVLTLYFYVYIQIDDNKFRTHTSSSLKRILIWGIDSKKLVYGVIGPIELTCNEVANPLRWSHSRLHCMVVPHTNRSFHRFLNFLIQSNIWTNKCRKINCSRKWENLLVIIH